MVPFLFTARRQVVRRLGRAALYGLLVGTVAGSSATAFGEQNATPYDVLREAWAPYVNEGDPYGFPLKVSSIAESKYKFWRGTKDLYYGWAKGNTADWLADESSYVICHGDLHPGNIGTYAVAQQELAFGWVDFDDSARLPFQLELLHGLISLHVIAETNSIALSGDSRTKMVEALVGRYRDALTSEAASKAHLAANGWVQKLLAKSHKPFDSARKELLDETGQFRATVENKSGKIKEVLQDASDQADAIAAALTVAIDESAQLRTQFRIKGIPAVRAAIKDIASRARVGSSGSQGLRKYYVLLANPLSDLDGDAVVYLKQQIPSAAERAGIVPPDDRTPAQRCIANMQVALEPHPWVCGAVEVNGASYWISLREPWSDELDAEDIGDLAALREMAEIWGTVTGAAHQRSASDPAVIAARLTPELTQALDARAIAYGQHLATDYAAILADARTANDIEQVKKALTAAGKMPAR